MLLGCLSSETEIKQQIERTRSRMNRMAEELGHVHPEVMKCSEQLDELLLQYYAIALGFRRNPVTG